jgi:hypothetical protein
MCWTCCIENLKAQIAKEDIKVYKIVRKANKESCVSLFIEYTYYKNSIHPSLVLEVRVGSSYSFAEIKEGYHSYSSVNFVYDSIESGFLGTLSKIVQCGNSEKVLSINNPFYLATFVIPKNSVFFINEEGVIVSNEIRYTGKYIKL